MLNNKTWINSSFTYVELDSAEDAKVAFEVLKEGGKVFCEVQETILE
jgi:hypothetical protein